jgi:hypothetical protein
MRHERSWRVWAAPPIRTVAYWADPERVALDGEPGGLPLLPPLGLAVVGGARLVLDLAGRGQRLLRAGHALVA